MVAPATSPGTLARQITLTFAESPTRTQDGGLVVFKCAGAPGEYVTRLENGLKSPDGEDITRRRRVEATVFRWHIRRFFKWRTRKLSRSGSS